MRELGREEEQLLRSAKKLPVVEAQSNYEKSIVLVGYFHQPHFKVKQSGDLIRTESNCFPPPRPPILNFHEFVRRTFIISNNEPCPKSVMCPQLFANYDIKSSWLPWY